MWDPTLDPNDLAARVDHTLLRAGATEEEIRGHVAESRAMGVAGACIAPCWVGVARELLEGTAVKVVTVVGFPLGSSTTRSKVVETEEVVRRGADEIDAVVHLGMLRAGRFDAVARDLAEVVQAAGAVPVKAILETVLLDETGIRRGAEVAERAGARFVKTSTGFGPGGATVAAVRALRTAVGDRLGVKAAGGIRTLERALSMLAAGADRLGTSATAPILAEAKASRRA
jgi:deoxyribose-phosphate aldolase